MQSKGFQALLYALMEDHAFSRKKNRKSSGPIFRPAFSAGFPARRKSPSLWIRKPIWGREGRGIDIINEKGRPCIGKKWKIRRTWYAATANPPWCSSTYRSRNRDQTDVGILEGYVTLSCFMLGDRPSAIYARFSEEKLQEMKHTGYRCSMRDRETGGCPSAELLLQAGQSLSFVNFCIMTVDKFPP